MFRVVSLGFLVLCLAGCSGEGAPGRGAGSGSAAAPARSTAPADAGPDGGPHCEPPSPIRPFGAGGLPEVRGTGRDAQLWGLIMTRGMALPPRTGEDVKIVWRMTGSGALTLSAIDPGGRPHKLVWGPEEHGGSSYDRPGDEWGAGYRFPRPGCWRLRADRGGATADVWMEVAAR